MGEYGECTRMRLATSRKGVDEGGVDEGTTSLILIGGQAMEKRGPGL